jgi:hypothetical protein
MRTSGFKFSITTSERSVSRRTSLFEDGVSLVCRKTERKSTEGEEHTRPAFFLVHIDRYTLLVVTYTAKPRTRPIDIKFATHAQRIPAVWRFDFDDFCAKMPDHDQTICFQYLA